MFGDLLESQAKEIIDAYRVRNLTFAAAESCTGGLLSALFTEIPGSSVVFEGGAVTYSNALKYKLLGVPQDILATHGAVSKEVASAMALGAKHMAGTNVAISITGIAGPDGGTEDKPVGLVFIGLAEKGGTSVEKHVFKGTRSEVRIQTILHCLNLLRGATNSF